jgi:hypothetical protein
MGLDIMNPPTGTTSVNKCPDFTSLEYLSAELSLIRRELREVISEDLQLKNWDMLLFEMRERAELVLLVISRKSLAYQQDQVISYPDQHFLRVMNRNKVLKDNLKGSVSLCRSHLESTTYTYPGRLDILKESAWQLIERINALESSKKLLPKTYKFELSKR